MPASGVRKQGMSELLHNPRIGSPVVYGEADWTVSDSMLQTVDVIGTLNSNLTGVDPEAIIIAERGWVGDD